MALRGNLKDFSLPDVFQLVTFSRKTGVLRIQRVDEAQGSVWFRDGDVFFAQSNWHTEPLGERLVRAQRLTPQALDRALQLRVGEGEGGRRLGQILIDEGYITDKVLESFVSEQIQETIFDLMRWDEGDFDFEAMPEAVEEDIGLSVSIENVIMEGSRRLEEWTRIKKKIPSVDVVFKMATAPGEGTFEISLKPMEWNLLLLVDGTRSVAELAHETDRTDFEVARIIYGLFSAGLLEFATDEEVGRLRAERVQREEKLAVIEAERRAIEEAAAAEIQAREAALAAEAEARRAAEEAAEAETRRAAEAAAEAEAQRVAQEAADAEARRAAEETVQADVASAAVAYDAPVEVPEFLGGMSSAPTADDAAVLEEMMGAVLRPPAQVAEQPIAPPAEAPLIVVPPHVPAEDPAFMAVEHVDDADLPMMPVPSVDELLTDLVDLRMPNEAAADEAASAVAAAWDVPSPAVVGVEGDLVAADVPDADIGAGPLEEPAAPMSAALEDDEADLAHETQPDAQPDSSALLEALVETTPEFEPETAGTGVPDEAPADPVSVFDFVYSPTPEDTVDSAPVDDAVAALEEPVALDSYWSFEPVAEPASMVEPVSSAMDTGVLQPIPAPAEEPVEDVFVRVAPVPGMETYVQEPPQATSLPEPETTIIDSADAAPVPVADFERDLMSLGLGELPSDLFGQISPAQADESDAEEPVYEWVESSQDTPAAPVAPGGSVSRLDEAPDFSELLESLDVDAEPEAIDPDPTLVPTIVVADADFDEDLLREAAPAEAGGVISTDAFLEDISMGDMDFSGGLTDELSALTGADRPSRPTANVNRIPEPDSGELLRRDSRVDKDTLLKIIDGIKNL